MAEKRQLQEDLRSAIRRCDVKKVDSILRKNRELKLNKKSNRKPKMNILINALLARVGKTKIISNEKRS